MDSAQLESFKKRLESRREALVAEGDVEIVPERGNDDTARRPDEDAQPLAEMSQVIASSRNRARTKELRDIADALGRLAEDPEGFGFCEECDDPIPPKRLELMPYATLCITCQGARENDALPGKRRHLTDYK